MAEPEINEDIELQKRNLKIQKYFRIGLFVFAGLSFLGFFGGGLLANGRGRTQDGQMEVRYPRFWRIGTEKEIIVTVRNNTPETSITFPDSIFKNFVILDIYPRPDVESLREGKIFYLFRLTDNQKSVYFRLRPQRVGIFKMMVGLVEGQEESIRNYILP